MSVFSPEFNFNISDLIIFPEVCVFIFSLDNFWKYNLERKAVMVSYIWNTGWARPESIFYFYIHIGKDNECYDCIYNYL